MTPRLTLLVLTPLIDISDIANNAANAAKNFGHGIIKGGKAAWGLVSNPAQTVEKAAGNTILGGCLNVKFQKEVLPRSAARVEFPPRTPVLYFPSCRPTQSPTANVEL